ncbi:MFS transporter [Thermomonospora cellulosilytica]|uniref:MFS family permease n=1 Tax=Thermomonospora cellulosilytica TaxID=1411118 RepID=A0A7W3N4K0_9ACTN|nr:MFS transporter [Thermomonospora cellulosilytica]MBA9007342.1 MFS family permease [Thermomonospora cellulosilytica]
MLFRARAGAFSTFALGGLLCGVWVSRMPALTGKFDIGPGAAGTVLLVWGVAALVAMQGLRGVIARAGSRAVLRVAAPLSAATAALVALAPDYRLLLAAVAAFGMAFGVMDVAMNAQASVVERAYRRPLMSGMHAGWCVGAMSGGLFGALTAYAGLSFTQTVLGAALVAGPAALVLGRTYLDDDARPAARRTGGRVRLPVAVYVIGALAFMAFMTEGAVADWSGLLLHEELHTAEWVAALGYPLFEAAMLAGRLVGDRVRTLLGTRRLLVAASLATAAGAGVVLGAPVVPVALAGFVLTGLAVCTIVPTLISLAGTAAPGRSDASVAQVSAMGYGGLLVGPVLIGWLAEATSLRAGLGLMVLFALLVAAGSAVLPIGTTTDLAGAYTPAEAHDATDEERALAA